MEDRWFRLGDHGRYLATFVQNGNLETTPLLNTHLIGGRHVFFTRALYLLLALLSQGGQGDGY